MRSCPRQMQKLVEPPAGCAASFKPTAEPAIQQACVTHSSLIGPGPPLLARSSSSSSSMIMMLMMGDADAQQSLFMLHALEVDQRTQKRQRPIVYSSFPRPKPCPRESLKWILSAVDCSSTPPHSFIHTSIAPWLT